MPELTSVSDVQTYLGDSGASSTLLTDIIAAAEVYIAKKCRRWAPGGSHWLTASRVERIDGDLAHSVPLRWVPVTAVASVAITTAAGTSYSITLTDLHVDGIAIASLGTGATVSGYDGIMEFYAASRPQLAWFEGGWPRPGPFIKTPNFGTGRRAVVVTYTGGYTTAAPDDLNLAATMLAAQMYRDSRLNPTLSHERLGDYEYTRATAEHAATLVVGFEDILAQYTRPTD